MAETKKEKKKKKKKKEKKKKKRIVFILKKLTSRCLKPKVTIPNPCQNLTEINKKKKKIPKKNYSPHRLSFFFKKLRKRMHVYHKVVVVWAKPHAEVQRWWSMKKVAEGFGSGRHHFGDRFCWRKRWLIEKQ